MAASEKHQLDEIRETFVNQWGVLGSRWGINRTMAQIHALLMVSPEPMSTDQIMEALEISRGNAHGNLKELSQWRLVHSVLIKGERKEFFEAEKDVAKMFSIILRERKSREFDPALEVLRDCRDRSKGSASAEGKALNAQVGALADFVERASAVLETAARLGHSKMFSLVLKRKS